MHGLGYRVHPLVLVGVVVGGAVAGVFAYRLRRRGWGSLRAAALGVGIFTTFVVAAVALAPSRSLAAVPGCALRSPAPLFDWRDDQRLLNMALYAPLGLAVVLTAGTGRRCAGAFLAVACLTTGSEALQSLPFVGRSCDAIDTFDNLVGAVAGTLIGWPLRGPSLHPRSRKADLPPAGQPAGEWPSRPRRAT